LDETKPAQLLIETNSAISAFDTTHAAEANFNKAVDECKGVLCFLWAATKKLVDPLQISASPDNVELTNWSKRRHTECIMSEAPAVSTASAAMDAEAAQALATSITAQTAFMENQQKKLDTTISERKNKFEKLSDSTQNLILNASSTNGEVTLGTPSKHCTEFYTKATVGQARQYLHDTICTEFSTMFDCQLGTVTALFSGLFMWDRDDTPSNFSFFSFPKIQPLSGNADKQAMVLHMKVSHGKGWSDTDAEEALKQGVKAPDTIESLGHQVNNTRGAAAFFFGIHSILVTKLEKVKVCIAKNTRRLESFQVRDKTFSSKIGYAIDCRIHRWLGECRMATDREQVNDSIIDFNILMEAILTDSFTQSLPVTLRLVTDKRKVDEDADDNARRRKKGKNDKEAPDSRKVDNEEKIPEWIFSHEEYQAKVAGKFTKRRPDFKGKAMCPRFHSKGYCFNDCSNKVSHVHSKSLPSGTKKDYEKFVKVCKGE